MYLRTEEYMPYAPDDVGDRVRVNHDSDDCSGDSNSMTIERKHDGVYAKCFRCGKYGVSREAKPRHFFATKEAERIDHDSSGAIRLPYDSERVVREWPSKARVWVARARITDEEVERYGLAYSARLGRVVLPIYSDGDMVGYQARKIYDDDPGPKYYTRTKHPDRMVFISSNPSHSDTIVLCEDVLSAIRVGRFVSSGAILGTSTSDYALGVLTEGRKYGIIYLDYDNRIVINNTIKLKNKLELLLDRVSLISNSIDPKQLSDKDLESLLSEYL